MPGDQHPRYHGGCELAVLPAGTCCRTSASRQTSTTSDGACAWPSHGIMFTGNWLKGLERGIGETAEGLGMLADDERAPFCSLASLAMGAEGVCTICHSLA